VPKRKRKTFDLGPALGADELRIDPRWADPMVTPIGRPTETFEDEYLAIPEAERERHILGLFARDGIVKIYAARHLSFAGLSEVARTARPETVSHYRHLGGRSRPPR